MKFYSPTDIKNITLPKNLEEASHHKFLAELQNPNSLIDNVKTEVSILEIDGQLFPVTINHEAYDTCYTCSIYTAFISYAKSEILKIKHRFIKLFLCIIIKIFEIIFRLVKIDRVISHNNFLLSTNLYPKIQINDEKFKHYLHSLSKDFPNHAFIFRSLNKHSNKDLITKLISLGFKIYPTRQVYIFDKKKSRFKQKRNFKFDINLLKKQDLYDFISNDDIKSSDYLRIVELYKKLYIDKYSEFNPKFNEKYIELSHKTKLIEYFGLRNKEGVLDAVVGCYDRGEITTTPIVGYDTDLPQELGLYRMLMAYSIDRADKKNLVLNLSSGASNFKILRGGEAYIEYSALYKKHLPLLSNIVWEFLRYLLNYVAVPIMKFYKL